MTTGQITTPVLTQTVRIDSNLSGKENHFVNFDATDDNVVNIASDQTLPSFILLEGADGSSTEASGTVALLGTAKLKISEAVTAGKYLVPDANGQGEIADAAGERFGAVALENGASGDKILVLLCTGEVEASDA